MIYSNRTGYICCFTKLILVAFCLCFSSVKAAEKSTGQAIMGLADKYIGDRDIEKDPDVIFVEDFELNSLDAVKTRWESVQNVEIMSLSDDVAPGSAGKSSLLMSHVGGKSTGGHLYRRLLPGYDQLYVRFYVKFDPDCYQIHHFFHVGGYNPPTPWPQGGAGIRPTGDERFTTGIEPYGDKWRWDFYSYWMKMRSSPDNHSWGHDFINDPALTAQRGKWICVELMMKMNDPVTSGNGEQALWIDGKPWIRDGQLVSHLGKDFPKGKWIWDSFIPNKDGEPFEGFQWRKTEDLKLNFLWVLLYITKAPEGYISNVWFDHIVVAKNYIGPMGMSNRSTVETDGTDSMKTIKVAMCQTLVVDGDKSGNFQRIESAVTQAAQAGAQIACLPETALLGWVNPDAHRMAHSIPGPDSQHLCDLARKYKIYLCVGLCEKDGDNLYDSVLLIDDEGKILLKHRKINILTELMTPPYSRGGDVNIVETKFGKVGLLICADTHVDEILDRMAKLKPDLLIVPYGYAAKDEAWPEHGKALEAVVKNAAKKTGAYCIGTNSIGRITHGPWTGMSFGGQSVSANPKGEILATAKDRNNDVCIINIPSGL